MHDLGCDADLLEALLIRVRVVAVDDDGRVLQILLAVQLVDPDQILIVVVRHADTVVVHGAAENHVGEVISIGRDIPPSVNEVVSALGGDDGIEHDGQVAGGRVLHAGRDVHAGDGHPVLLVLDGARADRDIAEQVVEVAEVFGVKHLIGCREAGLLDGAHVKLADGDDACEQVGLLGRVRLMEQSLVTLPGRARLVRVDARNDQDAVGNLLLHLLQAADVVHDSILVVRAAGADDQDETVILSGEDVADLLVALLLCGADLARERVALLDLGWDRKLLFKMHGHSGCFLLIDLRIRTESGSVFLVSPCFTDLLNAFS